VSGPNVNRLGTVVGERFQIAELIGRGAMAEVFRAVDLANQTFVALKILKQIHVTDPTSVARFAREADVQARVRHRNVAALLGSGVTSDTKQPYLAVELLRGKSLRSVLKSQARVHPQRAASYAWQALQGLNAVHASGILHRDLKPANIMLEPSPGPVERVILIDFGFATLEGAARLTQQGTVVGSLTYIAPERLRGEGTDPRADLYAIGLILFELLTGRPAFVADDDFSLIDMHVNSAPPSLSDLDPTLPRELDAVVQRALAKYPDERYATAAEMARALEQAAQRRI
jgi:eukaryotic-like serine/threonine-protein kinase